MVYYFSKSLEFLCLSLFIKDSLIMSIAIIETNTFLRHNWAKHSFFFLECGGTIFAEQGSFTSANFPSQYPSDVKRDCIWIITTTKQQKLDKNDVKYPRHQKHQRRRNGKMTSLTLFFDNFKVGNGKSRTTGKCEDDYVEVREGKGFLSPYIVRYCGGESPSPVTTTSGSLYIRFHTSGKNNNKVNKDAKKLLTVATDVDKTVDLFKGFKANFKTDSK